ncbi:unnamed protein product [Eruca vesicaria subsp. sativa]|uniref:Uncharacterized protein n=1 Tax=Eruca vesicaria subsp. sativa TaxID=29727 RepID=A0ABC8JNU8_ERUVS|nr:unnamed protein product [Eruca vesicaria subsp. sativa]
MQENKAMDNKDMNKDDQNPLVYGIVKEIYQHHVSEETEPSNKQVHCLLIPNVEELSESNKAVTVSSESLNPHPFTQMKKKDKLETTSSASVTTTVPSKDLAAKVAERKTILLQYQEKHPPPRYERNMIPFLSQNLRSPFEPGTQVKGVLTDMGRDSVYPIGSTTSASQFFDVLLKPWAWLLDDHMDAALSLYRLRFQKHPSMFQSSRIAIMDIAFQMLWTHQYKNWQENSVLPGGTYFYYYGIAP